MIGTRNRDEQLSQFLRYLNNKSKTDGVDVSALIAVESPGSDGLHPLTTYS